MRANPVFWRLPALLALIGIALVTPAAMAADDSQQQFRVAFFLQTHEHDPGTAAAIYQKVIADAGSSATLKAEAQVRLAECQEDQAAANLAQLMPADTMAYAEISQPGKHVGRLLQMIGLSREPGAAVANSPANATPLPGGLALPENFAIDPALVRELEKVQGAAVAITGVAPNGEPSGVAVVHLGDSDLVRGLIETGIQVLPQGEAVAGFPLYQVDGKVWIAATQRLVIVSGTRDQVAQTIARLKNPQDESLAKQPAFSKLDADRKGALAFAYLNGRRVVEVAGPQVRGQEAVMARALLDLDHLESISAALGTTDAGIQAIVKTVLADGHHNLAYGIVRTAPLTRESLAHIPGGAAAIAMIGLNPAAQGGKPAGDAGGITAMDIGREVFANINEISLFVLPGAGGESPRAMPEVGFVAAVKDPAKSEALWDQLLSLAALAGPQVAGPPQEIEIDGQKARQYQFNGAPPVVVVRLGDGAIAAGTRGAISAALSAEKSGASIARDAQFQPLLDGLRPESSKAVLIHAGRVIAASPVAGPPDELRRIAGLVGDLRLMLATHEKPNELVLQATASGLPNLQAVLHTVLAERPRRSVAVRAEVLRRVGPQAPAVATPPAAPQPPREVAPQVK